MKNGLPPSHAVRRGIGFVLPAARVEFGAQAFLPGKSAMYLAFSAMAARSDVAPARWRKPFLIWMDGVEAGWAIPLLLIGFIAVWLAFLVIAYIGGDLHSDVLETWTLGRRFEWGYSKHPPLDCMSLPQMRRLTLDVATRVTRMGRAEPQTWRASRGPSYRSLCRNRYVKIA
jgi:hypothetical protein